MNKMKRCPTCNLSYTDDSLEFCLEDGSRLFFKGTNEIETQFISKPTNSNPANAPTVALPFSTSPENVNTKINNEVKTVQQTKVIKERAIEQGNKILEIAPIVIALAHNWWQWIYLNNQSYSSFTAYFLSANFLIWLALLIVGLTTGLLSIKRLPNKGFAVTGLITLAVNLILFLVPKR